MHAGWPALHGLPCGPGRQPPGLAAAPSAELHRSAGPPAAGGGSWAALPRWAARYSWCGRCCRAARTRASGARWRAPGSRSCRTGSRSGGWPRRRRAGALHFRESTAGPCQGAAGAGRTARLLMRASTGATAAADGASYGLERVGSTERARDSRRCRMLMMGAPAAPELFWAGSAQLNKADAWRRRAQCQVGLVWCAGCAGWHNPRSFATRTTCYFLCRDDGPERFCGHEPVSLVLDRRSAMHQVSRGWRARECNRAAGPHVGIDGKVVAEAAEEWWTCWRQQAPTTRAMVARH